MAIETDLGQHMYFEALSWAAVVQKYQGLLSIPLHILGRCNYHSSNPEGKGRERIPLPWQAVLPPITQHKVTFVQTKPVLSLTATCFPTALRPSPLGLWIITECCPPHLEMLAIHQCPKSMILSCLMMFFLQAQACASIGHYRCASGCRGLATLCIWIIILK